MPSTEESLLCRRRITSVAETLRTSSGLRVIWMRPELSVVLVPSTPMKEEMLSTAGSASTTSTSFCCNAAMAGKLTVCGASLMPRITPVSCTGKKPLGMTMNKSTVATKVEMVTSSVAKRWRRMIFSARP